MGFNENINFLTSLVKRSVDGPGNPQGFDARAWLDQWFVTPIPVLGHRHLLDVQEPPGGLDLLRGLLLQPQSGTFS